MTDPIHVYAGTAGHSAWFSDDAGETWVHPNSHSGMYLEARVWGFAMHPRLPHALYAATDHGAFRWDETTARWTALPSPMQDVWQIAVDPADPRHLIAGTRPAAFWWSGDAGATWTQADTPGMRTFSEINMGPTRTTQIVFDPVDPRTVWAVVEIGGVFRSRDRGRTWTLLEAGLVSSDMHGLAIVPRPDGTKLLLATTNRGLHRSIDEGEHWTLQPLDSPWQYTRAVVPRADTPRVIFLTNGNGPPGNTGRLLVSTDWGDTWTERRLPGELNSTPWCVATHPSDPLLVFCCTNLGQLFRSTDGGETWTRLPHEFGEVRALAWRPLAAGTRQQPHSLTRAVVKPAPAAA